MLKSINSGNLNSSLQQKFLNSLPDDRPITAIQIVENLEKCPRGFIAISKTHDQDSDADLRESSIFKSTSARYLCLSKTEGLPNFVVQEILVLADKAHPPKGFSLLNRTADSEQKAWRKKQICYRLVNKKDIKLAITDIIVCSRQKRAPPGFESAGELNGVLICYKMGNVQDTQNNQNLRPTPPERPPKPNSLSPVNPMYPSLGDSDHDYEILRPGYPGGPTRPAPKPPSVPGTPQITHQNSTYTLSFSHGLDGVPFVVNPKFLVGKSCNMLQFPRIKARTMQQILADYDYPFTIERQS